MEIFNFDTVSFKTALLLFGAVDCEVGCEPTLAINDAKTGCVIWIRIMVENITDDTGEMGVTEVSSNLAVSNNFTRRNRSEKSIDFFGEYGMIGHDYSV